MSKIKIIDESNDRKYFSLLPHYILNHSTAIDQAVYMQLKKYAGEGGIAYPSHKTLISKLGITRNTLKKSIDYLITRNWIKYCGEVEVETRGGKQKVASYSIVDIWKLNIENYEGVSKKDIPLSKGCQNNHQRGVTKGCQNSAPNKNHINKNHIKEDIVADATSISFLLKKFESIDLKNKNYYGNTTQRKACDFLLREYGEEVVNKIIDFYLKAKEVQENGNVEQRQNFKYLPLITTPFELQEKWGKLGDFVKRNKQDQDELSTRVIF